jgi:hypothetical protein
MMATAASLQLYALRSQKKHTDQHADDSHFMLWLYAPRCCDNTQHEAQHIAQPVTPQAVPDDSLQRLWCIHHTGMQ